MKIGLYVGSFDPITLGHIDVIRQALAVFDHLQIGVGINSRKSNYRFTVDERVKLIEQSLEEANLDVSRFTVASYTGSMMQEARAIEATSIVRGLRQMSDFNDEFLINGMVAKTLPETPMTYFICRQEFLHVSSSAVKELAALNEDFSWMVTRVVADRLVG